MKGSLPKIYNDFVKGIQGTNAIHHDYSVAKMTQKTPTENLCNGDTVSGSVPNSLSTNPAFDVVRKRQFSETEESPLLAGCHPGNTLQNTMEPSCGKKDDSYHKESSRDECSGGRHPNSQARQAAPQLVGPGNDASSKERTPIPTVFKQTKLVAASDSSNFSEMYTSCCRRRLQRLQECMTLSTNSQLQLQAWDHENGLPKSHSPTMVNTSRSRKQLQEGVVLSKWDGSPLINNPNCELGRPRKRSRSLKK